jgi:hypothetical protein
VCCVRAEVSAEDLDKEMDEWAANKSGEKDSDAMDTTADNASAAAAKTDATGQPVAKGAAAEEKGSAGQPKVRSNGQPAPASAPAAVKQKPLPVPGEKKVVKLNKSTAPPAAAAAAAAADPAADAKPAGQPALPPAKAPAAPEMKLAAAAQQVRSQVSIVCRSKTLAR